MGVSDGSVHNYQRNLYTKTRRAYCMDSVPGNTGKERAMKISDPGKDESTLRTTGQHR